MTFKNQRWAYENKSAIDMDLDHTDFGWIPITIVPHEYPELWAEVIETVIGPYEAALN